MVRRTVRSNVPFGWCLTGNHDRCEVTVISMGKERECSCTCKNHGVNYRPAPPPSDLLLEMLEKWRPSK